MEQNEIYHVMMHAVATTPTAELAAGRRYPQLTGTEQTHGLGTDVTSTKVQQPSSDNDTLFASPTSLLGGIGALVVGASLGLALGLVLGRRQQGIAGLAGVGKGASDCPSICHPLVRGYLPIASGETAHELSRDGEQYGDCE